MVEQKRSKVKQAILPKKGCGQKTDRNHTNILFRAGAVKECSLACPPAVRQAFRSSLRSSLTDK